MYLIIDITIQILDYNLQTSAALFRICSCNFNIFELVRIIIVECLHPFLKSVSYWFIISLDHDLNEDQNYH